MKELYLLINTIALQMKNSLVRPMYRYCLLVNPIITTILLYEMFLHSGQNNFGTYIILGSGLMSLWGCICFSSIGDIHRERYYGTLAHIYISPSNFSIIILGKIIGNTLLSIITIFVSYITCKIFFDVKIEIYSIRYMILSIFVLLLCFITISIVLSYLLTLSRKTQLYMNCLEIPIVLACGFIVPVDFLPKWIHPLCYILSPTWAVKLLRMSISIVDPALYFKTFYVAILISVIYIILAHILLIKIDKHIRINATLEVI